MPAPEETEPDAVNGRRDGLKHWTLAFLAFFLIIGAWSVAAPYDGSPDETQHIIRAAGVVVGEVMPKPTEAVRGSGAYQTVPRGLIRDTTCWHFQPWITADCAEEPGSDSTPISVGTGAGRYHPFYYALVGWPLVVWPGWPGVILARLLSAAAGAALLAGAYVSIMRYTRYRLPLAGFLVALTPMVGHIGGAVNPNGLEMAAGIAFFSTAIPLLIGRASGRTGGVLSLMGISALLLAMLRTTGLLCIAIGFIALLVPIRFAQLKALWRSTRTRWWGAAIGMTSVASVLWIMIMDATNLGDFTRKGHVITPSQATIFSVSLWREYMDEMIGVTAWLDTRMSPSVYMLWESAAATLIIIAMVYGTRIDRWRLLALIGGGFLLPMAIQISSANTVGFITQGRYLLPMMAGIVVLAGFILEDRGFGARQGRALVRLFATILLPVHFVCLMYTMMRWQRGMQAEPGITSFNPFGGQWQPQLGTVLPVVAEVVGLLALGCLIWRAPRLSAGAASDAADGSRAMDTAGSDQRAAAHGDHTGAAGSAGNDHTQAMTPVGQWSALA